MSCPATLALAVLACACARAAAAPLHFSNVFGSHMVLRSGVDVPVWGWAAAGARVAVAVSSGGTYNASTDTNGLWRVTLPATPASLTPVTLTARASTGEVALLVDVLFGVVIFCSGQSNMEFTTNDAVNATAEVQAANAYPYVRITSGPLQGAFNLSGVANHTYSELAVTNLNWSVANNVSVGCPGCSGWNYFSAVCWFTLKNTFDMLGGGTPVGGIAQTYGGTSLQWWSSADAIAACPPAPGSACCNYGGSNSCLWNSQVAPYTIGPMPLTAAVWYQGEQNAGCGGPPQIHYYTCGLPAMIADFRAKFQAPALPYGLCLLAAWEADTAWFPELRLVQVATAMNLSNVFTVSTLDRGEPAGGPVHSPYKQDVGLRAAWALQSIAFSNPQPYLGPRYSGATVAVTPSTTTVQVAFDPATLYGAPLVLNTSVACPSTITAASCEAFAILTSDCTWHPNPSAALAPGGAALQLSIPTNASLTVVATRGYFANWPLVQLYNTQGLPADPWAAGISGAPTTCTILPPSPAEPRRRSQRVDTASGMLLDLYGA